MKRALTETDLPKTSTIFLSRNQYLEVERIRYYRSAVAVVMHGHITVSHGVIVAKWRYKMWDRTRGRTRVRRWRGYGEPETKRREMDCVDRKCSRDVSWACHAIFIAVQLVRLCDEPWSVDRSSRHFTLLQEAEQTYGRRAWTRPAIGCFLFCFLICLFVLFYLYSRWQKGEEKQKKKENVWSPAVEWYE